MVIHSGSSSTSSISIHGWAYDVFLSFRGEDTRKNFTDHLYTALVQAGIHTFRDNDELPRGQEISSQLLKAIQESKIAIVVFSKGYASSTWCLDELTKIMECKSTIGLIALPIFYDIDPSHVRKQKRSFGEAFALHEECFRDEMEKVNKWRKVLKEAANLSGWNLNTIADGHESKFIQNIVEDVLNKLNPKYLIIAKHPVGIDSRISEIIFLLDLDTYENVNIVGIHGMGGIGKTTIAKAAFQELCDEFEGSCFLFNVKDISKQPNGQVQLQEQLLREILKKENIKINNVDKGINLIRERLCEKRVLVVLDDIDRLEQLDMLVGERCWLGSGSRIIVTTRDEHLLTQFEVDEKYQVTDMTYAESLELLNWHAFKKTDIVQDYMKLLNEVVNYCCGLPLALEVLGSFLYKRSKSEWRSAIDKLQVVPHLEIQEKLRISFDTLDDDKLKGIFLDIACFFVGKKREYVEKILDGRGFFPEIGINVLIQRSLITVNFWNEIGMHDLLRDMGRKIVSEISPHRPGERNRIWFHQDAWNILNQQMGTDHVEGLTLDLRASKVACLSTKSFIKMRYLKLLQINGVHLSGSFGHLSKELTWLCWHACPLRSLPSDFVLDNLSVLDMQFSNIKELWKGIKFLNKLKILNVSYSKYLTITPNIHSSSLEKLILEGCSSLSKVHQSIGNLECLVYLNLRGCSNLQSLPESMCYLKSLETLDITKCSKLERLPEHLGGMESLIELLADETSIKQLPSSIGNLKSLRALSLYKCNYNTDSPSGSWLSLISSWLSPRSSNPKAFLPPSFACSSSLTILDLSYCGLSEDAFPIDFGSLSSLKELKLDGNQFFNLPASIGSLPMLENLRVMCCKNLLSISELPSSLKCLNAENCSSLERISVPSEIISSFILSGCEKLIEVQGIERGIWTIRLDDCYNLVNNFLDTILQVLCKGPHGEIIFPCDEMPDWFSHCGDTYSTKLSFHLPAASEGELRALLVWVVVEPIDVPPDYTLLRNPIIQPLDDEEGFFYFVIRNKRRRTVLYSAFPFLMGDIFSSNHSWVSYVPLSRFQCATEEELELCVRCGEELELSVFVIDYYNRDVVMVTRRVGVHLIVNKREGSTVIPPLSSYLDGGEVGEVEMEDAEESYNGDDDLYESSRTTKRLRQEDETNSGRLITERLREMS